MRFKNICEITITNCGFKENSKIIVHDHGFNDIFKTFKTIVTNDGFLH